MYKKPRRFTQSSFKTVPVCRKLRHKRCVFSPQSPASPSVPPHDTYLQVAVPGCIYYGPFQLESINKRNQRGQTRKLNALINLCHLHKKHKVTNNSYHLFSCFYVQSHTWEVETMPIIQRKVVEVQSIYVNSTLLELAFQCKALNIQSYASNHHITSFLKSISLFHKTKF